MPGIYQPHNLGFMDSRLPDIERRIQQDDPRLYLTVGMVIDRATQRVVEQRAEVRRHNEDGSDTYIGDWSAKEIPAIPSELKLMRLGAPGVTAVLDRIDNANAKRAKEVASQFKDSYGAMLEHYTALVHDRNNPRHTFYQVGGLRDEQ